MSVELRCRDLSSTPARKKFFGDHAVLKPENGFSKAKSPYLDIPPKIFSRGYLHKKWRKKLFSLKTMSNLGALTVSATTASESLQSEMLLVY
jgi:hypothetical protein